MRFLQQPWFHQTFSQAIPSEASIFLGHADFHVTAMTEIKSLVPPAQSLPTDAFISRGSFMVAQLSEAGGQVLLVVNPQAVLRNDMHFQSPCPLEMPHHTHSRAV